MNLSTVIQKFKNKKVVTIVAYFPRIRIRVFIDFINAQHVVLTVINESGTSSVFDFFGRVPFTWYRMFSILRQRILPAIRQLTTS